jgi:hypothetical protein
MAYRGRRRSNNVPAAVLRHLEDEEALIIPLILERTRDDPNFR